MRVEKLFEDAAAKGFRPCTPMPFPLTHIPNAKIGIQVRYARR
jgi:hypothetical protein